MNQHTFTRKETHTQREKTNRANDHICLNQNPPILIHILVSNNNKLIINTLRLRQRQTNRCYDSIIV